MITNILNANNIYQLFSHFPYIGKYRFSSVIFPLKLLLKSNDFSSFFFKKKKFKFYLRKNIHFQWATRPLLPSTKSAINIELNKLIYFMKHNYGHHVKNLSRFFCFLFLFCIKVLLIVAAHQIQNVLNFIQYLKIRF